MRRAEGEAALGAPRRVLYGAESHRTIVTLRFYAVPRSTCLLRQVRRGPPVRARHRSDCVLSFMAAPLLLPLLLLALLSLSLACSDPRPLPGAVCNNDTSAWEFSGDALVADALQLGSSDLSISGSLVVLPNATILLSSTDGRHGQLIVARIVALSGTLNVSYASLPIKRTANSLVIAQDIVQQFQTVHSQLQSSSACESLTVGTQRSGNSSCDALRRRGSHLRLSARSFRDKLCGGVVCLCGPLCGCSCERLGCSCANKSINRLRGYTCV